MVRTNGRSDFGHVITKIPRMGRLPHFLGYGATFERARGAQLTSVHQNSFAGFCMVVSYHQIGMVKSFCH